MRSMRARARLVGDGREARARLVAESRKMSTIRLVRSDLEQITRPVHGCALRKRLKAQCATALEGSCQSTKEARKASHPHIHIHIHSGTFASARVSKPVTGSDWQCTTLNQTKYWSLFAPDFR